MNRDNNNSRGKRRGRSAKRAPIQNPPPVAPSRMLRPTTMNQPNLAPVVVTKRHVTGIFDVSTDGINPTLVGLNFKLNQIPGYTEFTAMFQTYCIEKVDLWLRPEYTELTDAAIASNSVNVELFSAIDTTDSTAPASVNALLEFQSLAHTGITQNHYRSVRPSYLMDGAIPVCSRISTASPSVSWYGLKIAIPPTGTAMVFRSTARFTVVLTGLK